MKFVVLPLVFFAGLSIVMTWPLTAHLSSAVIGYKGDNLYYVWLIGWFQKALAELHANPLIVPMHNYPYGWNLAYTEISLANVLPALPFSLLANPTLAYNLSLLSSFVFSGFFVYLWVREVTGSQSAGLLAGTCFAFTPYRISHAYGHLPLFSTQYLVLHYWGLTGLLKARAFNRKYASLAGFGLGLAALSSMYYLYMSLIMSAVVVIVFVVLVDHKLVIRRSTWQNGLSALLIALPLITLAVFPYFRLNALEKPAPRAFEEVDVFSASPTDFIQPSSVQFIWRWLSTPTTNGEVANERALYIGTGALVLAAVALIKRREIHDQASVKLFIVCSMAAIILAMGTTFHWSGQQAIFLRPAILEPWISRERIALPLPNFWLYNTLPYYNGMRSWMRYGIYASLFASLLAGIGFSWVARQIKKPIGIQASFCIVLCLVILDLFPGASPLTRVEGRPVDDWLASHPDSGPYALFPIKLSLQSEAIYDTLLHDQPFLGMFPGAYLPRSFRSEWRYLRKFPDESSVNILRNRKIQTIIVSATEYNDWQVTARQIDSLGMKEIAVIGRQHIYQLGNP